MRAFALAVLVLVLAGWLLAKLGRAVRAKWFLVRLWHWFSGQAHHGKPITDAGWFRRGQRALTPTGHASWWWHLPRWQRAAHRTGGTALVFAVTWSFLVNWLVTGLVIVCLTFISAGFGVWRLVRRIRARNRRMTWLHPLHLAAHQLAGIPRAQRAESWIKAITDGDGAVQSATLELPPGWQADPRDEQRLETVAARRLGIEAPKAEWRRGGPAPMLMLTHAPKSPPKSVPLAAVREAIEKAGPNELVIGIGKGDTLVKVSLDGDSPHLAESMGSGAGKSVLARAIGAQVLYHGGLLPCLDYKMTSHAWARKLPNVAYADTIPKIHALLLWLEAEMERRNEVAAASLDYEGTVHANVGARMLPISEEINATMTKLRRYWADIREPGEPARSPAIDAHDALLFMGRQTRINLLAIAQMLSAKASGSGEARENMGIKMLGRYSANAWKMLCPEHPMPPKSTHPGRIQVVTTQVRECQVVFMTGREARELALAGKVAVPPRGMPCVSPVPASQELENPGPEQPVVPETSPPVLSGPSLVTLSEAVELRIVHRSLYALRKLSQRDPQFPERAGWRGQAAEYDPVELSNYDAGRR